MISTFVPNSPARAAAGMKQMTRRIAVAQLAAVIVLGLAWWIATDVRAAYSALLGGLAALLPNLYFARRFLAPAPGRPAREILRAFYWGEVGKLTLTVLIFAAAFGWLNAAFAPLFITFIAALAVHWVGVMLAGDSG